MNEKQRTALEASIAHWEENLDLVLRGEMPHLGGDYCACCEAFNNDDCDGCPIAEYTEEFGCINTPWTKVSLAWWNENAAKNPNWTALIPSVRDELAFLREVLEADR